MVLQPKQHHYKLCILIHAIMLIKSLGGSLHIIIFIHNYYKKCWVYLLMDNAEVLAYSFQLNECFLKATRNITQGKKCLNKKCLQSRKYLMSLYIVKDKEYHQMQLYERKVEYVKLHNNVSKHKRKHIHVHYKNLYVQGNIGRMVCYGSLSTTPSLFTNEDIYMGFKNLTSRMAKDLQGIKAKILK